MFDIVITGGSVIDGSRAPRIRADVGIIGDRIVQIGDLREAMAGTRIDVGGKVVAPGFIDVHNHSDGQLADTGRAVSKISQGFTTEVLMADGISYAPLTAGTAREWIYYLRALNGLRYQEYTGWLSLAEFLDQYVGRSLQNWATHIPYANVRTLACGWGCDRVDDFAMRVIQEEILQGMDAGAVGLSTGLDYIAQCLATTDELVEACLPLQARGGLYVSHVRYKKGTLAGIQEAVEIGRRAQLPVHISHLKAKSSEESAQILAYLDGAVAQDVDFSFDIYPYAAGSTMLNYFLPYEAWRDGPLGVLKQLGDREMRARFAQRLSRVPLEDLVIAWVPSAENESAIGMNLAQYVADRQMNASDALSDLLIEENLAVLLVLQGGEDGQIEPFLSHPRGMLATDGIYHTRGQIHPRQYGSAPRLLGPWSRRGIVSLEEGVWKLSGYPARRFGLASRGELRTGHFADVVVFDPETIADQATYADPRRPSRGMEHVLVNGVVIWTDGRLATDLPTQRPGRFLAFRNGR